MGPQHATGAHSGSARHSGSVSATGAGSTAGRALALRAAREGALLEQAARHRATKHTRGEGLMTRSHTIVEGDCCSSLAAAAGLPDYHSVYDHGDNADLKARRPNANALLVGDVVAVPEVETKTVDAATTRRHRYVVTVRAVKLRVKVLDREGRPLRGKAWRLTWGGGQRDGTLGSDGKIEAEVPATVSAARLVLDPDAPPPEPVAPPPPEPDAPTADPPPPETYPPVVKARDYHDKVDEAYAGAALLPVQWSLSVGALPTPNEDLGAQERLVNLGAWIEGERGAPDVWTGAAVKAFQRRQGQSPTGVLGEVRDALRDAHDKV